jgi:thiol-disulfide isomerase/thioredoxin
MRALILKYKVPVAILCICIAIATFLTYSYVSPRGFFSDLKNDLKAISPSQEFSYTDLNGNAVHLSTFKGKPLIVNSWASWMPFSQTELQLLDTVYSEYTDRLTILAINRMEQLPTIRLYQSTIGLPEHIILLADPTDHFYKAIQGNAMPETVFYNADGVLVAHTRGTFTEEELRTHITTLLDE